MTDEAKALIAKRQWFDCREMRLWEEDSEQYARTVNALTRQLIAIALAYADQPSLTAGEAAKATPLAEQPDDQEDEPGFIDLVAQFEEVSPQWMATIGAIASVMAQITSSTEEATARIQRGDAEGKGFSFRVVVARELAKNISGPADDMLRLGEDYATQLLDVDSRGPRASGISH